LQPHSKGEFSEKEKLKMLKAATQKSKSSYPQIDTGADIQMMLVFIDMEYRHEILTIYRGDDNDPVWTIFSKDVQNSTEKE
jgi:hypothetical protein